MDRPERGQYMPPGTAPPPTTREAGPEVPAPPAVGEITGLPLSRFATAELVARAAAHGCSTLWEYVEQLEGIRDRPWEQDFPSCIDPRHDELIAYVGHDIDCMKAVTGLCSCGPDRVLG